MTITNYKEYKNLPFDEYLDLAGTSYSTLKVGSLKPFKETPKMAIGKLCHQYLTEPHLYKPDPKEPQVHRAVRAICRAIMKIDGVPRLLSFAEPELSMTCDMHHNGKVFKYRGRMDLKVGSLAVIDIKISWANNVDGPMRFFGYDRQVNGYRIASGVNHGIILIARVPKSLDQDIDVSLFYVPKDESFWETVVAAKGASVSTEPLPFS